ncbi:MAG: Mth938-like domain-containing protein, partial [Sneathiella sp.]|nr:Mth938-like domain-containing protein [Sneathiella sp.]
IEDINALTTDHLKDVLEADPKVEILLIGCGENMAFIDEGLRNTFRANGTTIDSMDTGAAVRTYNVLLLEGRRVAVALMAV